MSGAMALRFMLKLGGSLTMKMRPLINIEHSTLCAQAGLDPVRFFFDLPESFRYAVGRGEARINGRKIDGFIRMLGADRPVGTITIAYASEQLRDDDPRSQDDLERLG